MFWKGCCVSKYRRTFLVRCLCPERAGYKKGAGKPTPNGKVPENLLLMNVMFKLIIFRIVVIIIKR